MKYIAIVLVLLFNMPQEQPLPRKVFKGKYIYVHEFGYMTICVRKDNIVIANESKSLINNTKETFDYEVINDEKVILLSSDLDRNEDNNENQLRLEDLTWEHITKNPQLLLQLEPGDTLTFTMRHKEIISKGYRFSLDKKWR